MPADPVPARAGEWRPGATVAPRRCWWHRFRWVGEDAFSGASLYAWPLRRGSARALTAGGPR